MAIKKFKAITKSELKRIKDQMISKGYKPKNELLIDGKYHIEFIKE